MEKETKEKVIKAIKTAATIIGIGVGAIALYQGYLNAKQFEKKRAKCLANGKAQRSAETEKLRNFSRSCRNNSRSMQMFSSKFRFLIQRRLTSNLVIGLIF